MASFPPVDHAAAELLRLWDDLGGDPRLVEHVHLVGPAGVLPSIFDVTGWATATVAAATLAVAELGAARTGGSQPEVAVDRLEASASFRFEGLLQPVGWELPPIWDPVAGDYEAADGWIRLHTNYRHHLAAVLEVLGVPAQRDLVAAAVAERSVDVLEAAVVGAGGCAAAMRTADAWAAHPAGIASASARPALLDVPVPISGGTGLDLPPAPTARPLAGVRVLDLTRVIAGPVATRFLAAYGADVLRIDPPGFEEVGALLPESTAGKRCAALDLRSAGDRARFEALVGEAHVLVGGLRGDALAGLGYGSEVLASLNPALVVVRHDAYGWDGPWRDRRGFDSLVQMSTGIAAAGALAAGTDRPTPLPAQALDHGLGHVLAAATCRALTRGLRTGEVAHVRGSLVGAANALTAHVAPDGTEPGALTEVALEGGETAWGPVRRVPLAGRIEGIAPRWEQDAGPLGRHEPAFATSRV